ncbi:MAG TPA: hypothetical protein VFE47_22250 [Tepidisphaeraceae bacterium]|jgi:hypothetical protein|nr:hypothetical protein [Tepidisphaeraceae bacterium]
MKRIPPILLAVALLLALFQISATADDAKKPATQPAPVVVVQPDGSLLLKAEGARIHGFKMHLEMKPEPTIIFWVNNQEYPEWPHAAAKKGTYAVEITYSCAPRSGGDFAVTAAANKIQSKTEETADWHTFKTVKLGNLKVLNDNTSISIIANGRLDRALMNVRSLKLTPIPDKENEKKK